MLLPPEARCGHSVPHLMSSKGMPNIHDASSHLKTVRDAGKALEDEGLLSCVYLPTPRGLIVAQKREGRL